MIEKRNLEGWAYYKGSCRNSSIAMWDPNFEKFIYLRTKFGDTFADQSNHPEDDEGYDVFIPIEKID